MHRQYSSSLLSSPASFPFSRHPQSPSQLHLRRQIAAVPSPGSHSHRRPRFSLPDTINTNFPCSNYNCNRNRNNYNLSLSQNQTLHRNDRDTLSLSISRRRSLCRPSLSSAAMSPEMDQLTSGASNRIIPIVKAVRAAIVFVHALLISLLVTRRRRHAQASEEGEPLSPSPVSRRKSLWRMEEEDTARRRALAEGLDMSFDEDEATGDGDLGCRWSTSLFFGVRSNALFCRSWVPASGELRGILIIIHGLNEHSGRYIQFAKQLNSSKFGVYAMDWTGHGGSDGLHGYVPSLDHVVADTGAFLKKIKSENPGVPCFLFGHSTGGAVVLKAASHPHIEEILEGIVLTSPALRVKPAHPIVGAIAPIFSLLAPKFQFKGANKRGIPVSRDPAALLAKYSDPLVYTGPIRVRTGHEILRISSFLMRNFKAVTVPFLVLHGTADTVTDPLASQDLYNEAPSQFKDIKLYEGFLHDLLFEPEREDIVQDIISWMEKRLSRGLGNGLSLM